MDSPDHEDNFHERIHGRSGHIAVHYKGRMLVWGGFQEDPSGNNSLYLPTEELLIYNSFTEVWCRLFTTGEVPERNSGSCGVMLDDFLYIFGGFQDGRATWFANSKDLYRLDMHTLSWTKLEPGGIVPTGCDKLVGWTYRGRIYFFGGFGPAPENPLNVPFTYVNDDESARGWNNQFLCYNPDSNEWSYPKTKGTTPSARAAHAADIVGNKLYIFGGRLKDVRMQSLHYLNMDLMEWSPELCIDEIAPEGRSWHSFTFINEDTAIVYGGFSHQSMILNDCWKLHVGGGVVSWEEVELPYDHGHPRFWHLSVCCAPGEIIIHGGQVQPFYQLHFLLYRHADCLLKLNFEPKSLLRLCLDTAVENFQVTYPQWNALPKDLQRVLNSRLEQLI